MPRPYPFPAEAGIEPCLTELLNDPLMHKLLARDGLKVVDVIDVVRAWQKKRLPAMVAVAA